MDFTSVVIFLILYHVRPQEWIGLVAAFKPVQLSIGLALLGMVSRRRGFHWRDLLQTPHDWMMLLYFIWIVGSNPAPIDTFQNCNSLFVFYLITVQALSTQRRIQVFLGWWAFLLWLIAGLAVASEFGFDPMYSQQLTHGLMKGRLVLNTSIFNNPNALGHSIFPVLIMLYFLCFWKRPVFMKIATLAFLMLPLGCLYLTASKGAFLAAFATIIVALSFGRPKVVQTLILLGAILFGWGALTMLPRMGELQKTGTDQAIQGRVAAWQFGIDRLKQSFRGVGQGNFTKAFAAKHKYSKASHGSYVEIGAELGQPGLLLFIGVLYTCLRTLWQAKTRDEAEERTRRILFAMLVAYAASSWMVDFAYRGSLFLLVGAIAAFHRQLLPQAKPLAPPADEAGATQLLPAPAGFGALQLAPAVPGSFPALTRRGALELPATLPLPIENEAPGEPKPLGLRWNRIHWTDWACIAFLTYLAIRFWIYIMNYM